MNLMIVESPNKIQKIKAALGSGWRVEASVGHVRDLDPEHKEGDVVTGVGENLRPRYTPTEKGASVIAKLRKAVKECDKVYLATDPDREGEGISWHLAAALGLKKGEYVRVTFNEITKTAIANALKKERAIDVKLVAAQEARRVLDRLVGFAVSPPLCNLLDAKVSAGRVQSPALGLVVERERAIRAFKPVSHYGVKLSFDGGWFADWDYKPLLKQLGVRSAEGQSIEANSDDIEDSGESASSVWQDKSFAELVAQTKSVVVRSCDEVTERRSPFGAFTTSTLQQAGGNILSWSPKKTMDVAQKLFEAGLITYHRTDSPNLSDDAIVIIRQLAQQQGWSLPDAPRKFKEKADSQGAHEACRPTHFEDRVGQEADADGRKLYQLIWKQAVASQLADALYDARIAIMEGAQSVSGKTVIFRAKGSKLKAPGWRVIFDESVVDENEGDEASNPVPKLAQGQNLTVKKADLIAKKTKPPQRFTMSSLVKKLENSGIGRPSTYAAIMDNIMTRDYIKEVKKKLEPTSLGEQVWDALTAAKFSFTQINFTRQIEERLDALANGKDGYDHVIGQMWDTLKSELSAMPVVERKPKQPREAKPVPADAVTCPKCKQGKLVSREGQYGAYWTCNAYPGCKTLCKDKAGKPDLDTIK
jgi:DNA topoisomerase-1